jgi:hypothetical protein
MVVVHYSSCYKLCPWSRNRHQGKRYPSGLGVHCLAVAGNSRLALREYTHIWQLPTVRVV